MDAQFGWTYQCNAGQAVTAINQVATAAQMMSGAVNSSAGAVQAFGHQANQASRDVDLLGNATRAARGSLDDLRAVFGRFADVPAILGLIVRAMDGLERRQEELARKAEAWRDSLRELANILGEPGPNNQVMAGALDVAAGIAATPEEAGTYLQAYQNIGPTVREKHHYGDDERQARVLEQQVLIEGGRAARRMKIDPETAGEAIGTMGLFHRFGSVEEAMDKFGGAVRGLSMGKVSYNAGFRALSKAAAKLADTDEAAQEGAARGQLGFDEAGVMLGVLSLGSGSADQAQHRMVQISRLVNAIDKPDKYGEKKTHKEEALAGAGIEEGMDDAEKFIALAKHLRKQADPMRWLVEQGLGDNVGSREAVIAGMKNVDVLEARLAELKGKRFGAELIRDNRAHFQADRSAIAAEARSAAGIQTQVEGEVAEPMDIAKQFADVRLRQNDPSYKDPVANVIRDYFDPIGTYLTQSVGGRDAYLERGGKGSESYGAIPTLIRQGQAVGVDVAGRFSGINARDPVARKRAFREAAEAVLQAGGDPYDRASVRQGVLRGIEGMWQFEAEGPGRVPGAGAAPAARAPGRGGAGDAVPVNRPAPARPGDKGAAGAAGAPKAAAAAPGHAAVDMGATNALLAQLLRETREQTAELRGGGGLPGLGPADPGGYGPYRA